MTVLLDSSAVRRFLLVVFPLAALLTAPAARARNPNLPSEAREGLEVLYGGDPDGAIEIFRALEKAQPDHPLGFLLEAEARWWKIYCRSLEVKWGMIDAWRRPKSPDDEEYIVLADRAIRLADARFAASEAGEMHLYAGLGWALKARLYGLRDERGATARAGVRAREEFRRALELDPSMADADTGLGLYNYYIATLSPLIKILRFFAGIPGGSKKQGIRQLETGMDRGELTAVEARFYLAKNLRTYDYQYERALTVITPLVQRYPRNPLFLLLRGNLYAELNRKEQAAADFKAVESLPNTDPGCAVRLRQATAALRAAFP